MDAVGTTLIRRDATPAPAATATVQTATPMPQDSASLSSSKAGDRLPFTHATLFRPTKSGYTRQECQYTWNKQTRATDAQGQQWSAFTALDRGYVLRVIDPSGRTVLNLNCSAALGNSSGSWLSDMQLDPDRKRLYVVTGDSVRAFDLTRGAEVGRLVRHDPYDLASISVTADGRVLGVRKDGVEVFTPDLQSVRRTPVEGFIPSQIKDISHGYLMASGNCYERNGTVYAGYSSHRSIIGSDGRVCETDDSASTVNGPDGSAWSIERNNKAVRRFQPATGRSEVIALEDEVKRIVPRADGSFLAVNANFHHLELTLHTPSGAPRQVFDFPSPYADLKGVFWSQDGRAAYVLAQCLCDGPRAYDIDLIRLDLDRSLAGRLRNLFRAAPNELPGTRLYSAKEPYQAHDLADGRIVIASPTRADLIDASGHIVQSCKVEEGESNPVYRIQSGPATLDPAIARVWLAARGQRQPPPRVWGPVQPADAASLPRVDATVTEADLTFLWPTSQSRPGIEFPNHAELRMRAAPDRIVVERDGKQDVVYQPPSGEHFTDAMALNVADVAYLSAGCDGGSVVLGRVDDRHADNTAHVYPAGQPVTRLGLIGAHQVVAECAGGNLLAIDLPLAETESARAGGGKDRSQPVPVQAARVEIKTDGPDVVINGIHVPRRTP